MVEARERSGALITADFALEEGREVLAVPGEITSALSAGTNALLPLGATPLLAAADILQTFGLEPVDATPQAAGELQQRVLDALDTGPAGMDELSRRTGLSPGDLAALLAQMELAGVVQADAGVYRPSVI